MIAYTVRILDKTEARGFDEKFCYTVIYGK